MLLSSCPASVDAVVSSDSLGKIGMIASKATNAKINRYGRANPSRPSPLLIVSTSAGTIQRISTITSAPSNTHRKRGNRRCGR